MPIILIIVFCKTSQTLKTKPPVFFGSLAANNTNYTVEIPSPAEKVSLMNNFG